MALNAAVFLPPVKISGIDPSVVVPVSLPLDIATVSGIPSSGLNGFSFWTNVNTLTGTGSVITSVGTQTLNTGYYLVHFRGSFLTASGALSNLGLGVTFDVGVPTYAGIYSGGPFSAVTILNSNPVGYPALTTPLVQGTFPSGTLGTLFDYKAIIYIPTNNNWSVYTVLAYSNSVVYLVSIVGEVTPIE
jgi:hypothetical protein